MKLATLLAKMDAVVPLACAEAWDNVGLLLGHPSDEINAALLTIDLSEAVLAEALALQVQLIIAYHPPWFRAQKRLVGDDLLLHAARAGLSIFSPHTALDSAQGGTNDVLADAAGVVRDTRAPLVAHPAHLAQSPGMGRVGALHTPCPLAALVQRLKQQLGLSHALVAPALRAAGHLEQVAVCAGAGDALLDAAIQSGAQALVVGEMRHHEARRATSHGVSIIALLHSHSERSALAPYAARLRQLSPGVTFHLSTSDLDPYQFA